MRSVLAPERLLAAYASGIFPMGDEAGRIHWFAPDPRAILDIDQIRVSRSLRSLFRRRSFDLTINHDFPAVIRSCAERPEGTWITREIIDAYGRLHAMGYAHSIEAWCEGEIAGGLYGVALGGAFFGESMFHRRPNASKVALLALVEQLRRRGFALLDIQFVTDHLRQFGAIDIPRADYERRLHEAVRLPRSFVDRHGSVPFLPRGGG